MDKATKRLAARNKAQRTPRGQLSPFEARGLGKKGKPPGTFPARQCKHQIGSKLIFLKRFRKTGEAYSVPLQVGGTRCPNDALGSGFCVGHLAHRR